MDNLILLIIGIIVSAILGYLIGKNRKKDEVTTVDVRDGILTFTKTDGEIRFVVEADEDGNDRVNCVFKVDQDWDVLMKKNYILFNVWRDPRITELEKVESN